MDFGAAYKQFIDAHKKMRSGERLRRLLEGHGYAEQAFAKRVWWPVFHHFRDLHPEYEVVDYKDGFRYIDFAYIDDAFRIAIEIDGYRPHAKDANRWQFTDNLRRQNQLIIDNWYVIRFAYDDIEEHPRICQQTIQQLLGRLLSSEPTFELALPTANFRETVAMAIESNVPITPTRVAARLNVSTRTARRILLELTQGEWLEPCSGDVRIRSYRLHHSKRFLL